VSELSRRQLLGGAALAALATALPAKGRAQGTVSAADATKPRVSGISRVIIDTDPGNDDALALLLALDAPNLHVEAITVCPGNLGPNYAQQVRNALYIVELAGKAGKVAVHAGMTHPLLNRPYPVASFIHGKYGLGDVEVPIVKQQIAAEHAVDAMRRIVNANPGEITILALGGLTNVAMAILRDPAFATNLKGILFIGGRYAAPPPVPGYNVLVDPEAADIVFKAGVPILLVGSDVIGRDSIMHDDDFDRVAAFNTPRSRFFIASNNLRRQFEKANRGTTGSTNPDPLGVAIAIDPTIATRWLSLYVHVELAGELTRGMLIYGDNIYTLAQQPPSNVDICVAASNEKFKQLVFTTLSR
jgi:inosine-uridine nucleoside N-ribohydrolase